MSFGPSFGPSSFTGRLLWPETLGSRPMGVGHRKEGTLAFPKRPSCRLYDENWSRVLKGKLQARVQEVRRFEMGLGAALSAV